MAHRNSPPNRVSVQKRPAGGRPDAPTSKRARTDSGPGPALDPQSIRELLLTHSGDPKGQLLAIEARLDQTPDHELPDLYRVLIDQASEQSQDVAELVYTVLLDHHRRTQGGELNEERLSHFGVSLALSALQPPMRIPPGFQSLPLEVFHGIAWQLGHLGVADDRAGYTRDFHTVLLRFMLSHRYAARALAPLMRVVRWCLQANTLWRTSNWQAVCEHLMRRPLSLVAQTVPGGLYIPAPLRAQITSDWLDAVTLAIVYLGPQGAEPLGRLFEAARHPRSAHGLALAHLPLKELELRLMQHEPSMNTCVMDLGDVDLDPIPSDQPSLALLLQHLPTAAPEIQLFVLGGLASAFDEFDDALQRRLHDFMGLYAAELRDTIDRLITWRAEFLDEEPDEVEPPMVAEIVGALQTVPVLGGELSVQLLLQLCKHAPLRAIATDAALIRLLERLLLNFSCLSDDLHELRLDYLLSNLPPELGVPAFNRLPVLQRARLLRTGYGNVYEPYLRAFAADASVERGIRMGVLLFLIRRLQGEGADHATVDLLSQLLTRL